MTDQESPPPASSADVSTELTSDGSQSVEVIIKKDRPWADPQSFLLIPMGVVGLFAANMASRGVWPASVAFGIWFLFYLNSGIVEHRQQKLSVAYRGGLVAGTGLAVAVSTSVEWMWLIWAMAIIGYAVAALATEAWRALRK